MSNHTKNYRSGIKPNTDNNNDKSAPAPVQEATHRKRARLDTTTSSQPSVTNRNTQVTNPSPQQGPLTNKNVKSTKPKPAHAIQWNIRGLRGRIPELQLMTNELKPRVLALQETMFDDSKYVEKLNGSKYKWYIKPGPNKVKNGVAIAIDKAIPHKEIQLQTELQAVACRTEGSNATTYVSIYIPPQKMKPSEVLQMMQELTDQLPKPFLLMGDFNAHSTEWGSYMTDSWGRAISKLIATNDLELLNNGDSTRISNSKSCLSALDLTIASSKSKLNLTWSVDTDNRGSDHLPIILRNHLQNSNIECKPSWILKEADWEKFQRHLILSLPIERDHDTEKITTAIYEAALDSIPRTTSHPHHKKVP